MFLLNLIKKKKTHSIAVFFFLATVSFGSCIPRAFNNAKKSSAPQDNSDNPLRAYLSECEKHLGPAPQFECSSAQIIPVQKTEVNSSGEKIVTRYSYEDLSAAAKIDKEITCDRPSMTSNDPQMKGCVPNSKIIAIETEHKVDKPGQTEKLQGVVWFAYCGNLVGRVADTAVHDQLAVIGYNKATGATCFIDPVTTKDSQGKFTVTHKNYPAPRSNLPEVEKYWKLPDHGGSEDCTTCHSGNAFLRIPSISQLSENKTIFPRLKKDSPYFIVGAADFRKRFLDKNIKDAWDPKFLSVSENFCTTCHAIGNKDYCNVYSHFAFGKRVSGNSDSEMYFASLSAYSLASNRLGGWHFSIPPFQRQDKLAEIDKSFKEVEENCKNPSSENWKSFNDQNEKKVDVKTF